jgi:hypothetical protein
MKLYKIITKERQKHFYEAGSTFQRGLKYHVNWLNHVKSYLPYLTVKSYKIECRNNKPYWKHLKTYYIDKGQVKVK